MRHDDEDVVLVLQGGGALGAYQAGVFEVLAEVYREPAWVAGISIGAINSALIVGNPPETRLARLREFWQQVSSAMTLPVVFPDTPFRALLHSGSANQGALFGVPGFFTPRIPPAPWQPRGTPGAISFYDTAPLKLTLERLVDFDRINDGPVRLSVGTVNVRTGNFQYFDTRNMKRDGKRLDARHIMASGALPPGFAPVEIDGEHYWDGGLVSNTPLEYVLDQPGERRRVIFQVDLFAAHGALPDSLPEVGEREKDIRFSSRTRFNTTVQARRQKLAAAARRLLAKLPPELREDPDARLLASLPCAAPVDIVHLIYRSKHSEGPSKDYEFSRPTMLEHWDSGRADMAQTLAHPDWVARDRSPHGMQVYDLAGESPSVHSA